MKIFAWLATGVFGLLGMGTLPHAQAWSDHDLITAAALADGAFTESLTIESLENFLSKEAAGVAEVFTDFANDMEARRAPRFQRTAFSASAPTREAFLRAARLNPETAFGYQAYVRGGHSKVGPQPGSSVSALATLALFSDEPDWQFDRELWRFPEYGYGPTPPYGELTGISSQAPFHMWFRHEPWILQLAAPEMKEGMTPQRVNLFARLAELAFRTKHRYWGYRFTAWVLHYVQDMSQPYHARALPSGTTFYFLKFAFSADKPRMKAESSQLVKNRHFIFEDTIREIMRGADPAMAKDLEQGLRASGNGTDKFDGPMFGVHGTALILERVARLAARSAPELDTDVVRIFGEKRTNDPAYDLERDPEFKIAEVVKALSADERRVLVKTARERFAVTGAATRAVVRSLGLVQQ